MFGKSSCVKARFTGAALERVQFPDADCRHASFASVTLGPGNVNFVPSGTSVTVTNDIAGSSTPNACTGKWVPLF